jgi:hypothetical protein
VPHTCVSCRKRSCASRLSPLPRLITFAGTSFCSPVACRPLQACPTAELYFGSTLHSAISPSPLDRHCTLVDPDSLDPLAQLASLRELGLHRCAGVTPASLERLLSTAVQGCELVLGIGQCGDHVGQEACADIRSRVLAQRGSKETPMLRV